MNLTTLSEQELIALVLDVQTELTRRRESTPTTPRVKVTIPGFGDSRFKMWARRLDTTKANGYAFEGEVLTIGWLYELPVGTLILLYGHIGSRANNYPAVRVVRVLPDGKKETIFERTDLNAAWALEVRDKIAKLLEG